MSFDDMDEYFYQKQAIGQRFKQFRELLGKSRKEMVKEANEPMIQEQRIKLLEKGAFIPDIIFIQYFIETYDLNPTWLVKGIETPFFKKNSIPLTGEDKMINPQPPINQELNPGETTMISMMINSVYFFLDCVFIVKLKYNYRLVVLQHRRVLFDNHFSSIKKCKMVFDEIYHEKAWSEEIKAEWSHFYDPDTNWLEDKQRRLKNGREIGLQ